MTDGFGPAVTAAGAAAAASPLLASWSARLTDRTATRWWRPRRVSGRRWLVVAVVAIVLTALASAGQPAFAWWLFAAAGAVLAIVDAQTHRLPARLAYPLAVGVSVAFIVSAVLDRDAALLLDAAAAATVVGGVFLAIRFVTPSALGQGDVRVAAIAAAMVGPMGWIVVVQAQVLTVALTAGTALVMRLTSPDRLQPSRQVPMGPAIIVGTIAVLWL